jgi:hypothetical protein
MNIETEGRKGKLLVSNEETKALEAYNASIEGVYDSLKGFNSATEEARIRCEKAWQDCEASRAVYQREMAQRSLPNSAADCAEQRKLEDHYAAALMAYDAALNAVRLPSDTPGSQELEKIDGARSATRAALALLEDHKRQHGCGKARPTRGTATALSA